MLNRHTPYSRHLTPVPRAAARALYSVCSVVNPPSSSALLLNCSTVAVISICGAGILPTLGPRTSCPQKLKADR